jgi:hypothetical protein
MNELKTNGVPDCRLCHHFESCAAITSRFWFKINCTDGNKFEQTKKIQMYKQKKPPEGLSQLPDKEDVEL